MKIVIAFVIMGLAALTMVWFEDWYIDYLMRNEYELIESNIMRWLVGDPIYYSNDVWNAAYLFNKFRAAAYRFVVYGIFTFMTVCALWRYRKKSGRLTSAALLVITALFFSAQFHVPIIDHGRHHRCYFHRTHWNIVSLEELNEPCLFHYNVGDNETIYRIIHTRGRGHPRAVRVHLNHAERIGTLHFTFFGMTADMPPEKRPMPCPQNEFPRSPLLEKSFPLDAQQYREITQMFSRYRFWNTPSTARYIGRGWSWVLEGAGSNRYHYIRRSNPSYGNVAALGNSLLHYASDLLANSDYEILWFYW
ncbi:MAG: hypothetical protein FWB96_11930 [Defluviitaleaceae bacterium]|nr:hypothetical protein [Defluviitaleaceae bacterium]MCL2263803.1 hypothetical protein [Defluviitaleaceae bacterium]